ncbi:matrixin family metalloprotease, partial [Nocardia sp. NPDC051570]|uniref:matrixin family metalloprotease n=1 Tax=Nocardia sp. NPDC051570 TaxID=3364324 RepID=UPI00379AFD68
GSPRHTRRPGYHRKTNPNPIKPGRYRPARSRLRPDLHHRLVGWVLSTVVCAEPPMRSGLLTISAHGGFRPMSTAANRRNSRGKHRAAQSPTKGAPGLFATMVAGSLLVPGALSLATAAPASAAAPSLGFKAPVQGYDSDGRAIIHYNNKINDPDIENAVKNFNSTPGLNFILKPGSGRGAINISRGQLDPGVAGLGGMDESGPFVKIDANNRALDSADRTEVAGHELLHAMGLDHNDSGCSIMASVVNRCNSGPTPLHRNEIDQLNSMYKRGKPSSNQSTPGKNTSKPGDRPDSQSQPKPPSRQPGKDDSQSRPGKDGGDDSQSRPGKDDGDDSQSQPGKDGGDDSQSRPGKDGGDDSQSQPGQDGGDDSQSQPGQDGDDEMQSQPGKDSGDDWLSQLGLDGGDDSQSQPSQDGGGDDEMQSQPGKDSGDDWLSQLGLDGGDDSQSQQSEDGGGDWLSQLGQDAGGDWKSQSDEGGWDSQPGGGGFDWFGDSQGRDIADAGDMFSGGDRSGGGDGFDWFNGGGLDNFADMSGGFARSGLF